MFKTRKKLSRIWKSYRWRNPDEPITLYYPKFHDTPFNYRVLSMFILLFIYTIIARDFALLPWTLAFIITILIQGELNKDVVDDLEWADLVWLVTFMLLIVGTFQYLGILLTGFLAITLNLLTKYLKRYNYCWGLLEIIKNNKGELPFQGIFVNLSE